MDEAAETGGGALLLLEQRRAGEADVTAHWEDLFHVGVAAAVLAAMALIDQHEDVGIVVA